MAHHLPVAQDQAHRPVCAQCLRPQRTCICHWITPTAHQVEVVVLQHPLEVHQAKGTGRLLHLSLPHSVLVVGETFDDATLHAYIRGPLHGCYALQTPLNTLLLYPESESGPQRSTAAASATTAALQGADPSRLRLIVLDATWRKSRKMLHTNPLLQALPRLELQDLAPSQYSIRKAHQLDQRSTLEASCAALAQLEGNTERYAPLLQAFEGFVAQQARYRGAALAPSTAVP
jgi:DTW domain-containing protein YfiP